MNMTHSDRIRSTTWLASAFVMLGVACGHEQPPPASAAAAVDPAPAEPVTAEPEPSAGEAQPEQQPAEAAAAAPKRMPYENPSEEALGKLPADIGLAPGTPAPEVTLPNIEGQQVDIRALAAQGPVMLVFYRGGWCPYCNFQIHELTEAYPEFQQRGVTPVAISVDRVEEGAKTKAMYEIPFPVISDPELVAHQAYHVVQHVDDETLAKLQSYGIDIEQASGRDHHNIAVPSVFVIDRSGAIVWSHAELDYKVRPSASQLLAVLDRVLK